VASPSLAGGSSGAGTPNPAAAAAFGANSVWRWSVVLGCSALHTRLPSASTASPTRPRSHFADKIISQRSRRRVRYRANLSSRAKGSAASGTCRRVQGAIWYFC
jgi:hypothetical protein